MDGTADLTALKLPSLMATPFAVLLGFFGGFMGALAVGCTLAAVGSVLARSRYAYRCADCSRETSASLLLEGERTDIRDRQAAFLLRGALFGAGALIAGGLWVSAVVFSAGVDVEGPKPAPAPVPRVEETIAALERARDLDGLIAIMTRAGLGRQEARQALVRIGQSSVPKLLEVLTVSDGPLQQREISKRYALTALQELAPRTERAVDALIGFLKAETNSRLRYEAMIALGKAGTAARKAVPLLEPLLTDYQSGGGALTALQQIHPSVDWKARREAARKK